MTIWEAYDRQGRKWFRTRPTFLAGHDIFQGNSCQAPKKGDRVMRNYNISVSCHSALAKYYPKIIRVGEPAKRKQRKASR